MADIWLRPDLKTPGGEVYDIMYGGGFAGTLTLVYREGDRIAGAAQLDEERVTPRERNDILSFVQNYVREAADALDAIASDVILTCSPFVMLEHEDDGVLEDDWSLEAHQDDNWEDDDDDAATRFEFEVLDDDGELIAEVALELSNREASAIVDWFDMPGEEDIESVTEQIVYEFDEDDIDEFVIHHVCGEDQLDTFELTHEELLEDGEEEDEWTMSSVKPQDDYTAILARDDGDALTFEIYDQAEGGLPVATATVDVGEPRLSGFIELQHSKQSEDAGLIASRILQEVEKEQDVHSLHLSFLHRNQLIDEIQLENEHLH